MGEYYCSDLAPLVETIFSEAWTVVTPVSSTFICHLLLMPIKDICQIGKGTGHIGPVRGSGSWQAGWLRAADGQFRVPLKGRCEPIRSCNFIAVPKRIAKMSTLECQFSDLGKIYFI